MRCMQMRCICGHGHGWLPVRKRIKEKKRKTYCQGPTCWRADADGGVCVPADVLQMGLTDGFDVDGFDADGFDADALRMGLMRMCCGCV